MSISTVAVVAFNLAILGGFVGAFSALGWLFYDINRDARNDRRERVVRRARRAQQDADSAAYDLQHVRPEYAESMAAIATVIHETVRANAGPCTGMGAFVGRVRLYRTIDGVYLVASKLGLSLLSHHTVLTGWSGWATEAEGIRAYFVALDSWYGRDNNADGANQGGPSAHEAPIDHGHDLVAVHAALAADLNPADLDLTVGSLAARILNAANNAGYDKAEIRALDLADEDLLATLTVMAALNQPAR